MGSVRGTGLVLLAAGLLLGAGCATGSASRRAAIDPAWLARVPMQQMGPVEDARSERRLALDAQARAEVQLQDAKRARDVAKGQLDVANKQLEVEQSRAKSANAQGQMGSISQAERNVYHAQLARDVAERRVKLADKRVDAADAALELQKAHVRVEDADLVRAEYTVLAQNGDTRVGDINPLELDEERNKAFDEVRKKEKTLYEKRTEVSTAEAAFNVATQRLQAARPGVPRG